MLLSTERGISLKLIQEAIFGLRFHGMLDQPKINPAELIFKDGIVCHEAECTRLQEYYNE